MLKRREHPRSGPGLDRQWWFAAKLVAVPVATFVAAYVRGCSGFPSCRMKREA